MSNFVHMRAIYNIFLEGKKRMNTFTKMTAKVALLTTTVLALTVTSANADEMTITFINQTPVQSAMDEQGITTKSYGTEIFLFSESASLVESEHEIEYDDGVLIYDDLSTQDFSNQYAGFGLRQGFSMPGTGIDTLITVYGSIAKSEEVRTDYELYFGGTTPQIYERERTYEHTDFGKFKLAIQTDIMELGNLTLTPFVSVQLNGGQYRNSQEPILTNEYGAKISYAVLPNLALYAKASRGDKGRIDRNRESQKDMELGAIAGFYIGDILIDGSLYGGRNTRGYDDNSTNHYGGSLGVTLGAVRLSATHKTSPDTVIEEDSYTYGNGSFSEDYSYSRKSAVTRVTLAYQF